MIVSWLVQVVGRSRFLTAVGLSSLFLHWLSAEVHCQLPEATCAPRFLLPPSSHYRRQVESFSCFQCLPPLLLWRPFDFSWEKLSCLMGARIIQDHLPVSESLTIVISAMLLLPYEVPRIRHGHIGVGGTLSHLTEPEPHMCSLAYCFISETAVVP